MLDMIQLYRTAKGHHSSHCALDAVAMAMRQAKRVRLHPVIPGPSGFASNQLATCRLSCLRARSELDRTIETTRRGLGWHYMVSRMLLHGLSGNSLKTPWTLCK